jgi:hypothetical protein
MSPLDLESCRWTLEQYFTAQEDVLLAFLLGCRKHSPGACLREADFGVLLVPQVAPDEYFAARLRLASDLICLLHFPEVDVTVLNDAPLGLRFWALRRGVLVYCPQRQALAHFRAQTVHEYVGMQPFFEGFLAHKSANQLDGSLDPDPLSKAFDFFCLARPRLDDTPTS